MTLKDLVTTFTPETTFEVVDTDNNILTEGTKGNLDSLYMEWDVIQASAYDDDVVMAIIG